MRSFIIIALLAVLSACNKTEPIAPEAYTCSPSIALQLDQHPDVDALNAIMDEFAPLASGLQVAFTDNAGNTWAGSRGMADMQAGVALANCTRIPIASISKTITATVIMQMVDEGLITLDSPLGSYLPTSITDDLANATTATVRQALNHTSGIPDYLTTRQLLLSQNQPYLIETQREKLKYARGESARNAPGAMYNYSNTNYVLLGLVAEEVLDQALWEVIDDRIAAPLGLQNFGMGKEDDPIPDDVARPYFAIRGGKYVDITHFAVSDAATGDGGILTNATELLRFTEALFNSELTSQASLDAMTTNYISVPENQSDYDYPSEAYSLGITKYNTPKAVALGHTGATATYTSNLLYFPSLGTSFCIIITGNDSSLGGTTFDAREKMFNALLELATR